MAMSPEGVEAGNAESSPIRVAILPNTDSESPSPSIAAPANNVNLETLQSPSIAPANDSDLESLQSSSPISIDTTSDNALKTQREQEIGNAPSEKSVVRYNSIHERFFKAPPTAPVKVHTKYETLVFAFRTFGIVYGDLATSPLYVYPSISCAKAPDEDDYLGMLSIIFWTLSLIGVIKYTLIVMYSDDHGEAHQCGRASTKAQREHRHR